MHPPHKTKFGNLNCIKDGNEIDPWGYFGNFSTNRDYKHNRVVDCSMEILSFLKTYLTRNSGKALLKT